MLQMYSKISIVDTIINLFDITPERLSGTLSSLAPKVLHMVTLKVPITFDVVKPRYIANINIDSTIILKLSNKTNPMTQNVYEITCSKEWLLIYRSLKAASTQSKKSCNLISQVSNKTDKMWLKQIFGKFNLMIHALMILSHHLIDIISLRIMNIFFKLICNGSSCNIYSLTSLNTWKLCYSIFYGSERFMIQCDDPSKYEIQKLALYHMLTSDDFEGTILYDKFEFEILNKSRYIYGSCGFITVYRNTQYDTLGIIAYSKCNRNNTELNNLMHDVHHIIHNYDSYFDAYIHKRYVYYSIPDNIEPIMF